MPSIAQEPPTVQSSKKRRRDDNNHQLPSYAGLVAKSGFSAANYSLTSSHSAINALRDIFTEKSVEHGGLLPLAARKIIPLASAKRQRISVDDAGPDGESMQRSPSSSPSQQKHHQPQPSPPQQQPTETAARQELPDQRSRSTPTRPDPMSRCHICSRKPTRKADLDSFADCQGCGQRTCYVCIRECLGWAPVETAGMPDPLPPAATLEAEIDTSFTMLDADAAFSAGAATEGRAPAGRESSRGADDGHGWARGGGHRQMVCSRCCVEKGQDGDVVCLACLPFVEG